MAHIYHPVDLLAENTAVQQEADKAMHLRNELPSIIVDENDVQSKNLHWLKTHAQIVHQWIRKVENNIQSLDEEIIHQIGRRNCLRKAINTLKIAANVNAESQLCRSTKLDGDYQDDVAREIEKEKMLIDCANFQLRNGLAEIEEYIAKMKAAKEDLEFLWSFKRENYGVECDNINLKQSSSTTMLKLGSTRQSTKEITRIEWENNIEMHVKLAEKLLTESYETHYKIDEKILSTNQRTLWEQAQAICDNLMKKKTDVQEYVRILQIQLMLTIQKQREVEKTIQSMEDTIGNLRQSLRLSQTRLYNRSEKPIQEIFFDEAQQGLLSEEENIRKQILSLEKEISRLQDNIKMLFSQRIKIERELQLKLDNSWIDGSKCTKIRTLYPSVKDLSGF